MDKNNLNKKVDALFFGAHPDDVELCCGGTIIEMRKAGFTTGIIDITQGEMSTRGNLKKRQTETFNANKVLGISIRENLLIKDSNIQNNEENRFKIIKVIRKFKPKIIFLPYPDDRHPDHIHTSLLVKEAAFYSGLKKISTDDQNPEYRPMKNFYYMQTNVFEPSFILDISDSFEEKMKSIKCYKTQFFSNKNPKEKITFISDKKYIEYIKARAVFYGFRIGKKYGEPFFSDEKLEMKIEQLFY